MAPGRLFVAGRGVADEVAVTLAVSDIAELAQAAQGTQHGPRVDPIRDGQADQRGQSIVKGIPAGHYRVREVARAITQ